MSETPKKQLLSAQKSPVRAPVVMHFDPANFTPIDDASDHSGSAHDLGSMAAVNNGSGWSVDSSVTNESDYVPSSCEDSPVVRANRRPVARRLSHSPVNYDADDDGQTPMKRAVGTVAPIPEGVALSPQSLPMMGYVGGYSPSINANPVTPQQDFVIVMHEFKNTSRRARAQASRPIPDPDKRLEEAMAKRKDQLELRRRAACDANHRLVSTLQRREAEVSVKAEQAAKAMEEKQQRAAANRLELQKARSKMSGIASARRNQRAEATLNRRRLALTEFAARALPVLNTFQQRGLPVAHEAILSDEDPNFVSCFQPPYVSVRDVEEAVVQDVMAPCGHCRRSAPPAGPCASHPDRKHHRPQLVVAAEQLLKLVSGVRDHVVGSTKADALRKASSCPTMAFDGEESESPVATPPNTPASTMLPRESNSAQFGSLPGSRRTFEDLFSAESREDLSRMADLASDPLEQLNEARSTNNRARPGRLFIAAFHHHAKFDFECRRSALEREVPAARVRCEAVREACVANITSGQSSDVDRAVEAHASELVYSLGHVHAAATDLITATSDGSAKHTAHNVAALRTALRAFHFAWEGYRQSVTLLTDGSYAEKRRAETIEKLSLTYMQLEAALYKRSQEDGDSTAASASENTAMGMTGSCGTSAEASSSFRGSRSRSASAHSNMDEKLRAAAERRQAQRESLRAARRVELTKAIVGQMQGLKENLRILGGNGAVATLEAEVAMKQASRAAAADADGPL